MNRAKATKKTRRRVLHPQSEAFKKTTDTLISKMIEETGIPADAPQLNCFKELVRHLNPRSALSSLKSKEAAKEPVERKPMTIGANLPSNSKIECKNPLELLDPKKELPDESQEDSRPLPKTALLRQGMSAADAMKALETAATATAKKVDLFDPLPSAKRTDPPCIMCQAPSPTIRSVLLNVNDTAKILMAAVLTDAISFDYATHAILNVPLRMCISHARPVYEMMVSVIGARTERELGVVSHEKLTPAMDMYKQLKSVRDTVDGKAAARTQIGSFKMAIRTYYRSYTPKDVLQAERREKELADKVVFTCSADMNLSEYFAREKIGIRDGEVLRVLEAIKLPKHKLYLAEKSKEQQPSSSSSSSSSFLPEALTSDLQYHNIKKRRYDARKRRYDSYPEEFRDLMKPIDELYERQTAECRTEMKQIRIQKAAPRATVVVPPKRAPAGFSNPGAKNKRRPTDYAVLAKQRLEDMQVRGETDNMLTGKQLTRVVPDAETYKDLVLAAKHVYEREIKEERMSPEADMEEVKPDVGMSLIVPKEEVGMSLIVPKEEVIDDEYAQAEYADPGYVQTEYAEPEYEEAEYEDPEYEEAEYEDAAHGVPAYETKFDPMEPTFMEQYNPMVEPKVELPYEPKYEPGYEPQLEQKPQLIGTLEPKYEDVFMEEYDPANVMFSANSPTYNNAARSEFDADMYEQEEEVDFVSYD